MTAFFKALWALLGGSITIGSLQLPFSWLALFGAVLIFVGMWVVYRLINIGLRKLLGTTPLTEKTQKLILRWTRIVLRILYAIGAFGIVDSLFGARMFEYLERFFSVLGDPIISTGSTSISFLTLLLTIPVFYLASWAGRMSGAVLDQSLLSRTGLDPSRKFSIASLARYGVMVIVALVGLSVIGIDLSALAVLFGVLGIGVGFGLQNVVSNFFSGLIIILTRPIKETDRIIVDSIDGTVVRIRLLSTVVNTMTEETIIIPNSRLVNNSVHNYSYDSRSIIITNEVGVSYSSDLDRVIEILRSIGRENPYAVAESEVEVRVERFGDSSIDMVLRTFIRDVDDKYRARSWNNLEIWRRFARHDIVIPFPQIDLHLADRSADFRVAFVPHDDSGRGEAEESMPSDGRE